MDEKGFLKQWMRDEFDDIELDAVAVLVVPEVDMATVARGG